MRDATNELLIQRKTFVMAKDTTNRGTVDFLKYAVKRNELFPPYWTNKPWANQPVLVDLDEDTKLAIKYLVEKTWDRRAVGEGQDAKKLNHSKLVVSDVQRVENHAMYRKYRRLRYRLMKKQIGKGTVCPSIATIEGSQEVVTTELLQGSHEFLKRTLYPEVNEHYLFHGTTVDRIGALTSVGFDVSQSDKNNMFGRGIYLAETSIKADQYADPSTDRSPPGHKLKMILCRARLGNVFALDKARIKSCPPPNFNSVMGDGRWLHREFVGYSNTFVYPEYVITYTRE